MEDYQNLLARLINSATPTDQQKQKINSLLGLLEVGANVGTSSLAGLGGGLSYLGALPAGNNAAQHVKRGVENSLTYQPQTEQANRLLQLLAQSAAPFVKSGTVGAQTFADNVYGATGSPLLGAAARTAPTAIDQLLNRPRLGALGEVRRNEITAHHGGRHDVDQFRNEQIGSGAGAQAFGYGHYFADDPGVANSYRNAGGDPNYGFSEDDPAQAAAHLMAANADGEQMFRNMYRNTAEPELADAIARARQGINQSGYLYTVDIPDEHVARMMNWDMPLNEQPAIVQNALRNIRDSAARSFPNIQGNDYLTGKAIYEAYKAHRGGNAKAASEALLEQGIPGIRYLDQRSRAAGTGTMNTVVFDGNIVRILNRDR